MDPVVIAALILAVGGLLGVPASILASRWRRPRQYRKLELAMDDLVYLLREPLKDGEDNPTAMSLFHRLRKNHSLNYIVAVFYLLREQKIIDWERGNILKPKHKISLVIH